MVEENAFIAVVMTDNSVVKNKLIRIPDTLSDTQLQLLSTVLNSSFVGLTLEEMETLWTRWRPAPPRGPSS